MSDTIQVDIAPPKKNTKKRAKKAEKVVESEIQQTNVPETPVENTELMQRLSQFRRNSNRDIRRLMDPVPQTTAEFFYNKRSYLDDTWMELQLMRLHQLLVHNKEKIIKAFIDDYGINNYEAEIMEYQNVIAEIDLLLNNFKPWREQTLNTVWPNCTSESKVLYHPYGTVCLLSTKKDSLASILKPQATSIAAGNYNVVIPDCEMNTGSNILNVTLEMVEQLDSERVIVNYGTNINFEEFLQNHKVDMVFSTKDVEESFSNYIIASKYDIDFKSHSNGWSVGIVDQFADLGLAAKLITQKKFYKSGQDVHNLDLVFVNKKVSEAFITRVKDNIYKFYATKSGSKLDYGKMYDQTNFKRIMSLVNSEEHEGEIKTEIYTDKENLKITPIIIQNPKLESSLVNKKILGPVLPIIEYETAEDVQTILNKRDIIEDLFYFSKNKGTIDLVAEQYKYKNLHFNDMNLNIHNPLIRKAGVFSIGNNELNGRHGIQTFSKQTLYYSGLYLDKKHSLVQRLSSNPIMQRINRTYYLGLLGAGFAYFNYRMFLK